MATDAIKKYITIIKTFNDDPDGILTAYDSILKEELNKSPKQIGRLLKDLEETFDNIVTIENTKPIQYKLLESIDLFEKLFDNDNLNWYFELAKDKDPEVFKKLEKITSKDKKIYFFKNTPFEDFEKVGTKQTFRDLQTAVKEREYRTIEFLDGKFHRDVKCLKLMFMEGNWYIAYVYEDEKLKIARISFIKKVSYSKKEGSFQPKELKDAYQDKLKKALNILSKS